MSLYLGNNQISGLQSNIEPTRNIGQIIQSITPLTDVGLHLLDGALISGDGIYADFVDYMITLYGSHPECFATEANWQGTVNVYGACGKFVYDNVNNTIRLPKITGFIEGTIDSNALGELVKAGLPNIKGDVGKDSGIGHVANVSYGVSVKNTQCSGAFYPNNNCGYTATRQAQQGSDGKSLGFDASRSSSIYGNSNTVQPQSIKVYYYIVLATTTKTDIEVDIDEVASDLNSKADDSDVVHKTGREVISGDKVFTGTIYGSDENDLHHALILGHIGKDYVDFYEYGGVYNFYKNIDGTITLVGKIDNGIFSYHQVNSTAQHFEFIQNGQSPNNVSAPGFYLAFEDIGNGWQKIMSAFNFQVVSTLPANPNGNVFYFIPE